jgi:hypothetical protein
MRLIRVANEREKKRERVDPYFLSLNNKNSKRQQEAE